MSAIRSTISETARAFGVVVVGLIVLYGIALLFASVAPLPLWARLTILVPLFSILGVLGVIMTLREIASSEGGALGSTLLLTASLFFLVLAFAAAFNAAGVVREGVERGLEHELYMFSFALANMVGAGAALSQYKVSGFAEVLAAIQHIIGYGILAGVSGAVGARLSRRPRRPGDRVAGC